MTISQRLVDVVITSWGRGVAGSNWTIGGHWQWSSSWSISGNWSWSIGGHWSWSWSIRGHQWSWSSDVVSGSSSLCGNCLWREGQTVADSVAVPEEAGLPVVGGAAVAELCAALGPRRAASRPLEELHRGPEGGRGTAALPLSGSQQTGLAAASCEDNQYSLQTTRVKLCYQVCTLHSLLTTLLIIVSQCIRTD